MYIQIYIRHATELILALILWYAAKIFDNHYFNKRFGTEKNILGYSDNEYLAYASTLGDLAG